MTSSIIAVRRVRPDEADDLVESLADVMLDLPENQPHRADVARMLVPDAVTGGEPCATTFFCKHLSQ